jgi:hypothetical protein
LNAICLKDTVKRVKWQTPCWEKIIANHVSDKGWISEDAGNDNSIIKMSKQCTKLNNTKHIKEVTEGQTQKKYSST